MDNKLTAGAPATPAAAPEAKSYAGFLKNNMRDYGMLLSLMRKKSSGFNICHGYCFDSDFNQK